MPDVFAPRTITLRTLITPGIIAVKKYWKPFILLQTAAFLLVLAYYTSGNVRNICGRLSDFKDHTGLIFSAISAAIAGAFLPEVAKAIMLGDRIVDRQRIANFGFVFVCFAADGVIIDLQYRGLAWLLGHGTDAATIASKVVVDQFVATPIYGVPYFLVLYALRNNRYKLLTTARQISPHWYVSRVLPLLIPCWFYWIPMVSLIYSLPSPLQFCLFCFALAGWSLIMVSVATHESVEAGPIPAA